MSSQNPLDNAHSSYQKHELEKYWGIFWLNNFLSTLGCIPCTVQAPKTSAQKVIDWIRKTGSLLPRKTPRASKKLSKRAQRYLKIVVRRSTCVLRIVKIRIALSWNLDISKNCDLLLEGNDLLILLHIVHIF